MPLDTMEGVAAALREGPIFAKVEEFRSSLPPVTEDRPRKAIDFAPIGGWTKGSVVYRALEEAGDTVHTFADLADILQVGPSSALGMQLAALDILIGDIKD